MKSPKGLIIIRMETEQTSETAKTGEFYCKRVGIEYHHDVSANKGL